MRILRRIGENEMMPAFYGAAWRDWPRNQMVTAPVPLNLILGIGRKMWFRLVFGISPGRFDLKLKKAVLDERWRNNKNDFTSRPAPARRS